jgi:heme-degrading monooxygenase HmoA
VIARHWRGLAKPECADDYLDHLRTETFPQLAAIAGFVDGSISRRQTADGVEFLVVTRWQSLEAIARFAGSDVGVAVVPPRVQAMMVDYDRSVAHYDVVDLRARASAG